MKRHLLILAAALALSTGVFAASTAVLQGLSLKVPTGTVTNAAATVTNAAEALSLKVAMATSTEPKFCMIKPEKAALRPSSAVATEKTMTLTEGEYADITNSLVSLETLAKRSWDIQHSTESGRTAWHGQVVEQKIDDAAGVNVKTYADGYKYVETKKKIESKVLYVVNPENASKAETLKKLQNLPALLKEIRAAREDAVSRTNEVTVIIEGGK